MTGLLLRKAANRIGKDDVLTRIDAPVDCGLAVVFADTQARVGGLRDRASGGIILEL
ncbi:MAG: hypothetical protein GDA36_08665 [Rhodobacteraceae bacterium]|nr:hypothetical protein [Paracoccaceae bacterium]